MDDKDRKYDNVKLFRSYIVKTGFSRQNASREVSAMEDVRDKGYEYIPEIISLNGKNISMERVYGDTLPEHFKKFPKTRSNIKKQIERLVKIMVYKCNIWYSDYHTGNFLVDGNHNLWVYDFDAYEPVHEMIVSEGVTIDELYEKELEDALYMIDISYKRRNKV